MRDWRYARSEAFEHTVKWVFGSLLHGFVTLGLTSGFGLVVLWIGWGKGVAVEEIRYAIAMIIAILGAFGLVFFVNLVTVFRKTNFDALPDESRELSIVPPGGWGIPSSSELLATILFEPQFPFIQEIGDDTVLYRVRLKADADLEAVSLAVSDIDPIGQFAVIDQPLIQMNDREHYVDQPHYRPNKAWLEQHDLKRGERVTFDVVQKQDSSDFISIQHAREQDVEREIPAGEYTLTLTASGVQAERRFRVRTNDKGRLFFEPFDASAEHRESKPNTQISTTTSADWRRLEVDFRSIGAYSLRADWSKGSVGEHWRVCGDSPQFSSPFEALSRMAGNQVTRSAYCQKHLTRELLQISDPLLRWLETIKYLTSDFKLNNNMVWEVDDAGSKSPIYNGHIPLVDKVSSNLCLHLASWEDQEVNS